MLLLALWMGGVLLPKTAVAEKDEISVGLQTGLMLPGFSPTSSEQARAS